VPAQLPRGVRAEELWCHVKVWWCEQLRADCSRVVRVSGCFRLSVRAGAGRECEQTGAGSEGTHLLQRLMRYVGDELLRGKRDKSCSAEHRVAGMRWPQGRRRAARARGRAGWHASAPGHGGPPDCTRRAVASATCPQAQEHAVMLLGAAAVFYALAGGATACRRSRTRTGRA